MTLHPYLYCLNNPVNRVDPSGRVVVNLAPIQTGIALYTHGMNLATYAASSEDWRFFDLAEATYRFTPIAMGMAWLGIGAQTLPGKIAGRIMGIPVNTIPI